MFAYKDIAIDINMINMHLNINLIVTDLLNNSIIISLYNM